ncbi:tail protein [Streptococcus virus MS1]|nr:tail protein [Streptococcus virus MS1]
MTKFIGPYGPLHLNLYVDQISQDVTNNSSRVSWRATVDRDGGYRTWNAENGSVLSVWLNGSRIYNSNLSFDTEGNETTLASGEVTVPHNSDGTKTFSVWASFDPNNGVHGNITISTNYTLDNIPRSTQISSLEGDRNLGSLHTVIFNRKVNSFTHQVWYRVFGSDWIDLGKNHTTSVSFTPSLDLARYLPKSSSGTMDICIRTYNGTTQIGSDFYSNGWKFNIPDSVRPTFSGVSLVETTSAVRQILTGNNFLQIMSNIQVNFNNASGAYGSTIQAFHAELVGKNSAVNENGGKLGMMNFNGNATVRAWVTDTRGKQSNVQDVSINVIEYYGPSINFSVQRTRQNPAIIQALRNAKVAPITVGGQQKNIMQITFSVAPLNTTNFTEDRGSASGTFTTISLLTNSSANLAGTYGPDKSYIVKAKIQDRFTSTEFSATVATESVVLHYDKDGRLGVGKIVEKGTPGSIDARGNIYAGGDIFARGQQVQQYRLTNPDGALNAGQHNDVWNKRATEFAWRSNKYEDNPTGTRGEWGLFQNFWLDSWKMVQFFATMSGRMFLRTANDGGRWRPGNWKEFLFKQDMENYNWQKLVLQSGWNHHSTYGDAFYTKTLDGVVHLKGNVWKGSTDKEAVIAMLPEGFRPRSSLYLQALNNDYGNAILCIYTDGRLVVKSQVDNKWLNLDNVSFRI